MLLVLWAADVAAATSIGDESVTAVIVANRLGAAFVESLLNARRQLAPEIPIVVFANSSSWEKLTARINLPDGITINCDSRLPTSTEEYSAFLMSCAFWRQFNTTFVLLFQSDSRFCASSPFGVATFISMNYDYIGAPWRTRPEPDLPVGNGGLSLRRRAAQ